jgi:hypothetical protein
MHKIKTVRACMCVRLQLENGWTSLHQTQHAYVLRPGWDFRKVNDPKNLSWVTVPVSFVPYFVLSFFLSFFLFIYLIFIYVIIYLLVVYLQVMIVLMMEAVRTSQTSVYLNGTTRRFIPESCYLHTRRRGNLKSHRLVTVLLQSWNFLKCFAPLEYSKRTHSLITLRERTEMFNGRRQYVLREEGRVSWRTLTLLKLVTTIWECL